MTQNIREVRVEEYAYYVNKLRQNFGLATWIWRQIVTSQTADTKYKWPPYATERNPHEDFLRTPLQVRIVKLWVNCSIAWCTVLFLFVTEIAMNRKVQTRLLYHNN